MQWDDVDWDFEPPTKLYKGTIYVRGVRGDDGKRKTKTAKSRALVPMLALGLPVTYRGDRWEKLLTAMRRDKKSRGDLLRLLFLEAVGRPTRLEGPDPTLLAAAYAEVSRDLPTGRTPVAL